MAERGSGGHVPAEATDRTGAARPLPAELLRCIGTGEPLTDARFADLALRVFAYQYEYNTAYRAFCDRRGASPATVHAWRDIPAVPTDAFKAAPLLCGDPAGAEAVFQTSGTTAGTERRGRHYLADLSLYRAAALRSFQLHLVPERQPLRVVSLVPSPRDAPASSLSFMVELVLEHWGAPHSGYYVDAVGLDAARVVDALREAGAAREPVCLLATSFALVHLLDHLRDAGQRISLPAGSRVMDTGGFKGRSRVISRAELYAAVRTRLGVDAAWCVNEYGMTEMSSQFYDGVAGAAPAEVDQRLYRPPPWVRTAAVDPETLAPVPAGSRGVLRHWDLANLHSVLALQTADLGEERDNGFVVFGRATGAEARGCSLATEQLLQAVARSHPAPRTG